MIRKKWVEKMVRGRNNIVSSMWYGGINTVYKKSYARKIGNIHKALHYTKLSFIIFYGKMSQYSQYANCLHKKLIYFGLRVSTNFGLGVSAQFEYKKLLMEKQQYL